MTSGSSRVGLVIACYSAVIPLSVLSTALRLYAKQKQGRRHRFTLDDFLVILATICAVGECCVGLALGPAHGFGKHIDQVSTNDIRLLLLGDYIFSHFYNIALGAVKLSILVFYYRVFVTPTFRRIVMATIAFIFLWVLAITIALAVQCRPVEKFWSPTVPGKCLNLVALSYFTNISNLVTDLWIFFLPIPVIWGLRISNRRRLGLCGVFLIGLGTCVISSVRISVVVAQGSDDFTWDLVPLGIMSVFEPLGGILSANLPIAYALFRKIKASSTASPSNQSKSAGNTDQSSNNRRSRAQDSEDKWMDMHAHITWSSDIKSFDTQSGNIKKEVTVTQVSEVLEEDV